MDKVYLGNKMVLCESVREWSAWLAHVTSRLPCGWSRVQAPYQTTTQVLTGAMIGDGVRKSWDARRPMIWDNFSSFRTNCAILTSYIHAHVVVSRVDVVTLWDQILRWVFTTFLEPFFCVVYSDKTHSATGKVLLMPRRVVKYHGV